MGAPVSDLKSRESLLIEQWAVNTTGTLGLQCHSLYLMS